MQKKQTNVRQAAFVEAYIVNGGNATEAAKKVGYSAKTAKQIGSRLLTNVAVANAIEKRRAALQEKHGLTTDRILSELAKIAFADLRKVFDAKGALLPPEKWPDEVAAAMAGVDVVEMQGAAGIDAGGGLQHVPMFTKKVKLWDKNAAIEKAMKHLGLFEKDNRQTTPVTFILSSHDEQI